jgi:hypothetical protein
MLNKGICQRCFKEQLRLMRWNEEDDLRWSDGDVFCVVQSKVVPNKCSPEGCKYALEHVVAEDGSESRGKVQAKVRRTRRSA